MSPEPPCVEHLYVNGMEKTVADVAQYGHYFSFIEGEVGFQLFMHKNGGYAALDPADTYQAVVDTGTIVPAVATGRATNPNLLRSRDGDGTYQLTFTGRPIAILNACTDTCPFTAAPEDEETVMILSVDDGAWWGPDAGQVFGIEYFSNINIGGIPPDYDSTAGTLTFLLGNAHEKSDGTDWKGSGTFRLPNRFIREVWGVPDPATMTGSSLTAVLSASSGATGDIDIYQESGDDAMRIDLSNVSFSKRKLTVRLGSIKPTRNRITKDVRVSGTKAKLVFTRAKARGAKVRGYTARCTRPGHTVTTQGRFDTIFVTGLTPGKSYKCQVRAKSKAGPARWSRGKTV